MHVLNKNENIINASYWVVFENYFSARKTNVSQCRECRSAVLHDITVLSKNKVYFEYFECLTPQSVKSDRRGKLLISQSLKVVKSLHLTITLHSYLVAKISFRETEKCPIRKNKQQQKFRATRHTHLACFVSTINYHFHLFIVSVQAV